MVTAATGAAQLLLHGVRQSLHGVLGAPSSEPASNSKGDTGRKWLPEVCSSSMVSYLKLFLAFLMLRLRFANATLHSKAVRQTAVERCFSHGEAQEGPCVHPDKKTHAKAYLYRSAQAGRCSSSLHREPAAANASAARGPGETAGTVQLVL